MAPVRSESGRTGAICVVSHGTGEDRRRGERERTGRCRLHSASSLVMRGSPVSSFRAAPDIGRSPQAGKSQDDRKWAEVPLAYAEVRPTPGALVCDIRGGPTASGHPIGIRGDPTASGHPHGIRGGPTASGHPLGIRGSQIARHPAEHAAVAVLLLRLVGRIFARRAHAVRIDCIE